MSNDSELAKGLYFKHKHENAPDFVIGKLSVKKEDFINYLNGKSDEWVNFEIANSREGKPYIKLDTWKPDSSKSKNETSQSEEGNSQPVDNKGDTDLPF